MPKIVFQYHACMRSHRCYLTYVRKGKYEIILMRTLADKSWDFTPDVDMRIHSEPIPLEKSHRIAEGKNTAYDLGRVWTCTDKTSGVQIRARQLFSENSAIL